MASHTNHPARPAPKGRLTQTVTLGLNSATPQTIHRIAMAPLTRMRNQDGTQAPKTELAPEYYQQRASKNGLLITEATFISEEAGGYPNAPGIYSDTQIEQWKKVTDAVHAKGGLIWVQLWALGRANGGQQSHIPIVAPSPIPIATVPQPGTDKTVVPTPKEMTVEDIQRYMKSYKTAAENAKMAGFDGVELHGANGYLIDQFTQAVSNKRTDDWGGSVENRIRFGLGAIEAAVSVFGPEKVGIRISPWGRFQDMLEDNPYETFVPYVKAIVSKYPQFGYIHLTEPRSWTGVADTIFPADGIVESNDIFRAIIRGVDTSSFSSPSEYAKSEPKTQDPTNEHPIVILSAAGHDAENVEAFVERTGDVAVFGRFFIANPDLPERIYKGYSVRHYDRGTFYTPGPVGYIDLPTYAQEQQEAQSVSA